MNIYFEIKYSFLGEQYTLLSQSVEKFLTLTIPQHDTMTLYIYDQFGAVKMQNITQNALIVNNNITNDTFDQFYDNMVDMINRNSSNINQRVGINIELLMNTIYQASLTLE